MKIRKKPIVVDGIQWTGDNQLEIVKFMGPPIVVNAGAIVITTLEGVMRAETNYWIIKGVKGEFYPCRLDVFLETYDIIDQECKVNVVVKPTSLSLTSKREE